MWKYRNTSEMYLNNTHMYHSDTYLGEDFSDGIKHYKYIRKYQKNGHTYYVYDDSEARNVEDRISRGLNTEYKDSSGANVYSKYTKGKGHSEFRTWTIGPTSSKSKQTMSDKIKERAHDYHLKELNKFKIQKIKDIPRRIHARGLSLVSGFLKWLRGD